MDQVGRQSLPLDAQLYFKSISLLCHVEYISGKNPLRTHLPVPVALVSEGNFRFDTTFVFEESCSRHGLVVTY